MKKKTNSEKSNPDRSPAELERTGETHVPLPACERKLVKYGLIRPDPEQPRKHFAAEALQEMAESIRERGVVQDIGLEFVPARFKVQEPDLHSKVYTLLKREADGKWRGVDECDEKNFKTLGEGDHWVKNFGGTAEDLTDQYRLIWGERRWRGAGIAGLAELPAKVYPELTRAERFDLQMIENLQRENLSALENAEAFAKQLENRRSEISDFKPEQLAAELGKKRAWAYEQLKLTRLHAPVREAVVSGKISTSVAGAVAIVPLPNQQKKLLAKILNENDWHYPYSVRDVQEIVETEYVKQLKDAPFKLDDLFEFNDNKVPEGINHYAVERTEVITPCDTCMHRTGNLAEQFPELKAKPNACTRPDCFGIKCKLHWERAAKTAEEKGKTVLTMADFNKVKGNYIAGEQKVGAQNLSYGATMETAMGKHKPEPVLVATAKGLEKFYPKEEAMAGAKKNGTKFYDSTRDKVETAADKAKREAKEKADQAESHRRCAFVTTQLPALAKGLRTLKAAVAWKLAQQLLEDYNGYNTVTEAEQVLVEDVKDPQAAVLGQLLSAADNYPVHGHGVNVKFDENAAAAWKVAGVDLDKAFEAAEKEAQKTLALPAKAKPEQGKLLEVKPNGKKLGSMSAAARARIAAAAKARWAKFHAAK